VVCIDFVIQSRPGLLKRHGLPQRQSQATIGSYCGWRSGWDSRSLYFGEICHGRAMAVASSILAAGLTPSYIRKWWLQNEPAT
jgi:hypothetical protein